MEMGLHERRRDRQELVVLAMWSRSLAPAEQKWTVWEKEIRALRDLNRIFAPMIAGSYKSFHTDHLNNLVMGSALGNSDRVTRDLMEIEGSGIRQWNFMAGNCNILSDAISRTPLDRDAVREEMAERESKPATLRDVMRLVMGARGVPEEDLDLILGTTMKEEAKEEIREDLEVKVFMLRLKKAMEEEEEFTGRQGSVQIRGIHPVESVDVMQALYAERREAGQRRGYAGGGVERKGGKDAGEAGDDVSADVAAGGSEEVV